MRRGAAQAAPLTGRLSHRAAGGYNDFMNSINASTCGEVRPPTLSYCE